MLSLSRTLSHASLPKPSSPSPKSKGETTSSRNHCTPTSDLSLPPAIPYARAYPSSQSASHRISVARVYFSVSRRIPSANRSIIRSAILPSDHHRANVFYGLAGLPESIIQPAAPPAQPFLVHTPAPIVPEMWVFSYTILCAKQYWRNGVRESASQTKDGKM